MDQFLSYTLEQCYRQKSPNRLKPVLTEGESVKFVSIPLASSVVEGEAVVFLFVIPELLHVAIAWTHHLPRMKTEFLEIPTFGSSQTS